MKKYRTDYPRWYGIYGIEFIFRGGWSDPAIRYKQYILNAYEIEERLISDYKEYLTESKISDDNYEHLKEYIYENRATVVEYIKEAIEEGGIEGIMSKDGFINRFKAIYEPNIICQVVY